MRTSSSPEKTEPVGSDLFLDINFDTTSSDRIAEAAGLFKVRAQPDLQAKVGDKVPLSLPHAKLYLFDEQGRRVYPR